MVILVTTLCVTWTLTQLALKYPPWPDRDYKPVLSKMGMVVVPFVLFVRYVIENSRENRRRRLDRKSMTMGKG